MQRYLAAVENDQLFAHPIDKRGMHLHEIPNRGRKPTLLIRESYREEGRPRKRTLANVTHLPRHIVDGIRRLLNNDVLIAPDDAFTITRSRPHGHVDAVLAAMKKLGIPNLLASRPSRERDLVMGMIAARILHPGSKLETTRWLECTSLGDELGIADASENELYAAMDWLNEGQERIEKKLASRHLTEGSMALYDLTSTWLTGSTCPLGRRGYSRDGKKGTLQVNFGILTDDVGRPLATQVYAGNTADPATLNDQVQKVQSDFGIKNIVLVGDRGMITQTQIEDLHKLEGVDWISALKSCTIKTLVSGGWLQLDLFDERNLFSFSCEDRPGERFIACRNPSLARLRAHKREELLTATSAELDKIKASIDRGRLAAKDKIGLRVGRVINKYKMAKHFLIDIDDKSLDYRLNETNINSEAALDGIYVIRTSLSEDKASDAEAVLHYKRLTKVERAFRSLKTIDLHVRPIFHRIEKRVRAHIFLCMLAYYVEWHMRECWTSLLFADEEDDTMTRDPVAPSQRSESCKRKVTRKQTDDGTRVHSFATMLDFLGSIVRNTCRRRGADKSEPTFEITTRPNATQRRALTLIDNITLPAAA